MTKEIKLTQGYVALVDDEDFEYINSKKWHVHVSSQTQYAMRKEGFPKRRVVYIHRLVMDAPENMQVDHINGNGLDCRKSNLRLCTVKQNVRHARMRSDNTSGYKGVVWDKLTSRWQSQIKYNNKNIFLGRFDDPKEAAKEYDKAAIKYFGEFALTNKMEGII